MDPYSGKLYPSLDAAIKAGVVSAVEISGPPEAVQQVSEAVRAQRKARRRAQKKSRRSTR